MITIEGKGISGGIAAGPLYFYRREKNRIRRFRTKNPEAECRRFFSARDRAVSELRELSEKARREAGNDAALLFDAHLFMAEDPECEEAAVSLIREAFLNAEAAVSDTADRFAEKFAAMEDVYFRTRAADIRDVSSRIIRILTGSEKPVIGSDGPVILAADELSPEEIMQMDRSRILGFVLKGGSAFSHTAILARGMGIPAVIGAGERLIAEYDGREALIDGTDGLLYVDPDEVTENALTEKREEQKKSRETLEKLKGLPNETKDGQRIRILCNIGSLSDIPAVLWNDADGVGLFRSEFLYLMNRGFPSEESQFESYKKVLSDVEGKEAIIRTFDIGGDKILGDSTAQGEDGRAHESRGIRFLLEHPEILHTQLRALFRASAFGKLGIMFPMVTDVREVREAKEMCDQVKKELRAEGIPYSEDIEIGIMIETPAAAILSDRLAKEADFFSLGTNDLAQYTLAFDRKNPGTGRNFDAHHPAVLRLLRLVSENAHRNGIRACICGELAADLSLTETLLSLGFDELSVSPDMVLPLREKVRSADISAVREKILSEL